MIRLTSILRCGTFLDDIVHITTSKKKKVEMHEVIHTYERPLRKS